MCQRKVQWEENAFRPFCSERCQVIDLGAWASGDYAVSEDEESPSSLPQDDQES